MTANALTLSTIATAMTAAEPDAVMLIPLNKLKKSPRNARKTPHTQAHVEALAASIAAKGMLQNLVVQPETGNDGEPTGSYFVTIGEGRRLAHLLLVKRKEIKKSAPVRCVLDTVNDAHEISLDENVTREAMHPADQFEAFRVLAEERGLGAEEIAARFVVTAHVVKQRLRLGNISPRLMQLYRDGALTLDQLKAFALTDDHIRQEQVYHNLSYNRDPSQIRRELTRSHVAPSDRRAVLVGAEAANDDALTGPGGIGSPGPRVHSSLALKPTPEEAVLRSPDPLPGAVAGRENRACTLPYVLKSRTGRSLSCRDA